MTVWYRSGQALPPGVEALHLRRGLDRKSLANEVDALVEGALIRAGYRIDGGTMQAPRWRPWEPEDDTC